MVSVKSPTVLLPARFQRRDFLLASGGLLVGASAAQLAPADERPRVIEPRAIAGDPVEPAWQDRPVIRVGPRDADVEGADQRALQAAVDQVARLGGGTVRILPGTYRLRNAVQLQSR